MPLVLNRDPAGIQERQVFETNSSSLLIEELSRLIPDGFKAKAQIYENSLNNLLWEKIEGDDDINSPNNICLKKMCGENTYFVVMEPMGPVIGSYIVNFFIGVAINIAINVIFLSPSQSPQNKQQNQTQSPNNALESQQNTARLLQRRPKIIGQQRSYPDRGTQNPREFYQNNLKQLQEYLIVSEGKTQVESIRRGDTLVSDIPSSVADVYQPGQRPSELIVQFRSGEVGQAELAPPNSRFVDIAACTFFYDSVNDVGTIELPDGEFSQEFEDGDNVLLNGTVLAGSGVTINGTYQNITVVSDEEITIPNASTGNSNWTLIPAGGTANSGPNATISREDNPETVGPFEIPIPSTAEQIQLDYNFPRGLFRRFDRSVTIQVRADFVVTYEDTSTHSTSITYDFSGSRQSEFFFTEVVDISSLNPSPPASPIESITVASTRLTDADFEDAARQDFTQWIGMSSLRDDINDYEFEETTRIFVSTEAADQIATQTNQEINCIATQIGNTYNPATGNLDGPEEAITDMLNCTINYLAVDAGVPYNQLSDAARDLYDIQRLYPYDASRRLQLGLTLDSSTNTYKDDLILIATACRLFGYVDYTGQWAFKRDQAQETPTAVINRRNKKPDSENLSMIPYRIELNDGVELSFRNRDNNFEPETIVVPDDNPNDNRPNTENPLVIDGVGITTIEQAWDRAYLEYGKLLYQRLTLQSEVTSDALLIEAGDRIRYVFESLSRQDGEILGFSGLTVDTSNECIFESGQSYQVVLRDSEGNPSNFIGVTARTDTTFGFVLDETPNFALFTRGENDFQRGVLYDFFKVGSSSFADWIVQSVEPDENNNCTLKMVNYDARIYERDGDEPPTGA